MATITLLDPQIVTDSVPVLFRAAEAIVAGQIVVLDATGQAIVGDPTDSGKQVIEGQALTAADVGNFVALAITGTTIQVSNVLVVGQVYILAIGGDVKLADELATGEFLSQFGTVTEVDQISVVINNTRDQKA